MIINVARRPILNSELPDPSRAQGQSPIECLAAIAADQTLTELRRGGPTRPPIRPRMEIQISPPPSRGPPGKARRRRGLAQLLAERESLSLTHWRRTQSAVPLRSDHQRRSMTDNLSCPLYNRA